MSRKRIPKVSTGLIDAAAEEFNSAMNPATASSVANEMIFRSGVVKLVKSSSFAWTLSWDSSGCMRAAILAGADVPVSACRSLGRAPTVRCGRTKRHCRCGRSSERRAPATPSFPGASLRGRLLGQERSRRTRRGSDSNEGAQARGAGTHGLAPTRTCGPGAGVARRRPNARRHAMRSGATAAETTLAPAGLSCAAPLLPVSLPARKLR